MRDTIYLAVDGRTPPFFSHDFGHWHTIGVSIVLGCLSFALVSETCDCKTWIIFNLKVISIISKWILTLKRKLIIQN